MVRMALAYLIVFGVFAGILAAIHARMTPAVALLPMTVWPDVMLLSGLGKLDHKAAWICRIVGMGAILWTYAAKFIGG